VGVAERRARQHRAGPAKLQRIGDRVEAHAHQRALGHRFIARSRDDGRGLDDCRAYGGAIEVEPELAHHDRAHEPDDREDETELDEGESMVIPDGRAHVTRLRCCGGWYGAEILPLGAKSSG
jgi:hypothetical protein